MKFIKHSVFFYIIAAAFVMTIDFKAVHLSRLDWLSILMRQGGHNANCGVVLYDYMAHMDPEYSPHYRRLGDYYMHLGNKKQALRCYRKALALDPTDVQLNSRLSAIEK